MVKFQGGSLNFKGKTFKLSILKFAEIPKTMIVLEKNTF